MKKRILQVLLASAVFISSFVPANVYAAQTIEDQSVIYRRMIAMQEEYPEGREWTNSNTYTWNNIYYDEGSSSPYSRFTGGGCAGFAMILSDAAFGNVPAYHSFRR